MATPPPPIHALYFAHTVPHDWGINFDITKDLLENKLHIHVPLDERKPSVSAIGSCYWFRVEALKPLYEYGWRYEDFLPEGKMGVDGTISHAIERANGYIAQSQGYYPAWVMSDKYARIEVDSLHRAGLHGHHQWRATRRKRDGEPRQPEVVVDVRWPAAPYDASCAR